MHLPRKVIILLTILFINVGCTQSAPPTVPATNSSPSSVQILGQREYRVRQRLMLILC